MNIELLEELIVEGEKLTNTIYSVRVDSLMPEFDYKSNKENEYQTWKSSVQRFIKNFAPSDLEDFKKYNTRISPSYHTKILSILYAIKRLPNEPIAVKPERNLNIYNSQNQNNTQTQNNTQSIILSVFLESIKDEITGKQYKELQQIVIENENEPEKAKSKIFDKLKSFGGDVLSNILANIITNPNLYNLIM
jgi:hypothetical protein